MAPPQPPSAPLRRPLRRRPVVVPQPAFPLPGTVAAEEAMGQSHPPSRPEEAEAVGQPVRW